MPEYRAPGVYIEEQSGGPTPIQGVGTSTAGFLGETERGPTDPTFLTSFADFEREFGGLALYREGERLAGTYLAYAVEGFFRNGGGQCFVGRIEAEDMPAADAAFGPEPPSQARTLAASRDPLAFGTVPEGVPRTRETVVTNRGDRGDGAVAVTAVDVVDNANAEFAVAVEFGGEPVTPTADDPVTLAPGESLIATVTYTPGAAEARTDTLRVTHDGANQPLDVALEGTGRTPADNTLVLSTDTVDVGVVPVGVAATQEVTVLNAGGPGGTAFELNGVTLTTPSDAAGDPVGELDVEVVDDDDDPLEPGDVVTLRLSYTPTVPAEGTGTVEVQHTAGATDPDPPQVQVTGEGSPLGVDPVSVAFGAVGVGDVADADVTVENVREAGADVTVQSATVAADPADPDAEEAFEVTVFDGDTEVDLDAGGVALPPGEQLRVTVTFDPEEAIPHDAVLELAHDGGGSPVEIPLTGTGGVLGVAAVGPGVWGQHVAVIVEDGSLAKPDNELFKLTVRYWTTDEDAAVARRHDADTSVDAVPKPDVEEVYDNLSPLEASADYYGTRVEGVSKLVSLTRLAAGRPGPSGTVAWLDAAFPTTLPDVDRDDYQGIDDPGERTGLAAFAENREITIVCVPDEVRTELDGLTGDIRDHCVNLKDRVAVLQAPQGFFRAEVNEMEPPVDSDYAAFYYPWVRIVDSETNVRKLVPPGGHVAGIYARSDTERGVHKAPANETVRGAQELQVTVTEEEQAVLNPKGINCIRSFTGRGIRVYGARTTSSDPLWRYLNVRRLFVYVEQSIDRGTQYAVFEPNDQALWARVRQSVSTFLTTVWRDGALMGTTPEEAFYVKADYTTMTQADIDAGRLIVEIGIAPVKPAEFVVFRIAQTAGGPEAA